VTSRSSASHSAATWKPWLKRHITSDEKPQCVVTKRSSGLRDNPVARCGPTCNRPERIARSCRPASSAGVSMGKGGRRDALAINAQIAALLRAKKHPHLRP
jgi:hypothetical protein